jgi:actin-related protein
MADNLSSIVFDFGTCYSKIGEAAEEAPRVILPSMYCSLDDDFMMCAADTHKLEHYFGFDAFRREGILAQKEFFDSQRDVEEESVVGRFLHQAMYDNFSSSETGYQGVILLDKPSTSVQTKRKLAEVFLEWNKFQRFIAIPDYVGSLYATGKSTGIVASCGYSGTYAAAVFDGIPSPLTITEAPFNSRTVETQYRETLRDICHKCKSEGSKKGWEASKINTRAFLENSSLVRTPDSVQDVQKVKLPDGTLIDLKQSDITDPFEPYFTKKASAEHTLIELIQKAASQVSPFFRDQLFSNVVLEGGITKVPHFYERLLSDLSKEGSQKTKVINQGDRLLQPWVGASRLKDWIDDNRLWLDLRAVSEKGIERAMADIGHSF